MHVYYILVLTRPDRVCTCPLPLGHFAVHSSTDYLTCGSLWGWYCYCLLLYVSAVGLAPLLTCTDSSSLILSHVQLGYDELQIPWQGDTAGLAGPTAWCFHVIAHVDKAYRWEVVEWYRTIAHRVGKTCSCTGCPSPFGVGPLYQGFSTSYIGGLANMVSWIWITHRNSQPSMELFPEMAVYASLCFVAERREREGEGTGQGGGPSSHRGNMEAYSPGLGQLGTPGLGPTIIVTPPTIGHSHVLRESSPLIDAASPRISDLDPHMFLPRGYPPESAIGTMRHD